MASQVTERRLSVSPVTLRQERATGSVPGATRLEGYAALFNVKALISERGIQFYERVAPGAFALSVLEDDQRIAYNHDASRILGRRSAGTATIHEDARGLFYSVLINPLDPAAMSVMAQVQRRDVRGQDYQLSVRAVAGRRNVGVQAIRVRFHSGRSIALASSSSVP